VGAEAWSGAPAGRALAPGRRAANRCRAGATLACIRRDLIQPGVVVTRLEQMLHTHPHPAGNNGEEARAFIAVCTECAQICTVCADACLSEHDMQDLVPCIRLNLDCADVCRVTATLMTRPSHRDAPALRAHLEACCAIAKACADECDAHADMMDHCRICAEACRACAEACERMQRALVP
jgi:hypothetical protein